MRCPVDYMWPNFTPRDRAGGATTETRSRPWRQAHDLRGFPRGKEISDPNGNWRQRAREPAVFAGAGSGQLAKADRVRAQDPIAVCGGPPCHSSRAPRYQRLNLTQVPTNVCLALGRSGAASCAAAQQEFRTQVPERRLRFSVRSSVRWNLRILSRLRVHRPLVGKQTSVARNGSVHVTCAFERACSLRAPDHASIPGIGNRYSRYFRGDAGGRDRPSATCTADRGRGVARRPGRGDRGQRWFRLGRRTGYPAPRSYRCIAVSPDRSRACAASADLCVDR